MLLLIVIECDLAGFCLSNRENAIVVRVAAFLLSDVGQCQVARRVVITAAFRGDREAHIGLVSVGLEPGAQRRYI